MSKHSEKNIKKTQKSEKYQRLYSSNANYAKNYLSFYQDRLEELPVPLLVRQLVRGSTSTAKEGTGSELM